MTDETPVTKPARAPRKPAAAKAAPGTTAGGPAADTAAAAAATPKARAPRKPAAPKLDADGQPIAPKPRAARAKKPAPVVATPATSTDADVATTPVGQTPAALSAESPAVAPPTAAVVAHDSVSAAVAAVPGGGSEDGAVAPLAPAGAVNARPTRRTKSTSPASDSVTAAKGAEGVSSAGSQVSSSADGPSEEEYQRLNGGAHHDPHSILGAHPVGDGRSVVRTLRHGATSVELLHDGQVVPFESTYGGVWSAFVDGEVGDYRLRVTYEDGYGHEVDDPYRWLPTLGEMDIHLIQEGRHEQLWKVLGAHPRNYDTPNGAVTGTSFAVWAPNAAGVRVTGEFDYWSGAGQPMRSLGSSGIWEIFVPGVSVGTAYKYQILGADRVWRDKADPMANWAEVPPATASKVYDSTYQWGDADWIQQRTDNDVLNGPMSVYELHLGSWKRGLNYRELADALIADLAETGFTHVEFLPVEQHPFEGSWGYQVTGYYAADSKFGEPDDLRYLIDRLHQEGYGVLLDWVPGHFPKDEFALARFDGTALYEHPDPRRGEHMDWGTYIFDFGRREVRNFLVANALYWLEEFHMDGLRVDAVASMLYLDYSREEGQWEPNEFGGRENLQAVSFLQEVNATVGKRHPGVMMIAEESTSWPGVTKPTYVGGLGFHMKWNMGWMHDTLEYLSRDPIYRSWHHDDMTFSMVYAYSEQFVLPISHDEVVHGKGSMWGKVAGDSWRKAANLRSYYSHMWGHPGKQLLFMGSEIGAFDEWRENQSLPWWLLEHKLHSGLRRYVGDLNRFYREQSALWSQDHVPAGFQWLDGGDRNGNVFTYLRYGSDGSVVAVLINFSAQPHNWYRVGLPLAGRWREALNSDAEIYGGSGMGNMGAVTADGEPWNGQPTSATVVLPPLGSLFLVPDTDPESAIPELESGDHS